jgi:hypothetical protein
VGLQSISTPIEKTIVLFGEESQGDQARGKKNGSQAPNCRGYAPIVVHFPIWVIEGILPENTVISFF